MCPENPLKSLIALCCNEKKDEICLCSTAQVLQEFREPDKSVLVVDREIRVLEGVSAFSFNNRNLYVDKYFLSANTILISFSMTMY